MTFFNRAAEHMFGWKAEEICGRGLQALMPSPYREEHDAYIERYLRTGEPHAIGRVRHVEALRRSGEVFPIELSVSEARFGGEVLFTAVIRDVSERLRLEAELRSQRDFAERLIDTAQAIVLVLDLEGRVVRVNRYLEDLSGRTQGEVVGRDWLEWFIPERDRPRVRRTFEAALAGRRVRGAINAITTRGGEERLIEWYDSPWRDAEGELVGLLAIGQDITERVRAQKELERLQRLAQQRQRMADIGALTAKIVHDLANPLAALSMVAQGVLRRVERSPESPIEGIRPQVERLVATAARLDALLVEFKDFAREQRLDLQEIDLASFVLAVGETWEREAQSREIEIRVEPPVEPVAFRGDPEKLHRVFDNLIKNALEALDRGPGEVTIEAEATGPERIRIAVKDTGPGIPEGVDVFALFETTKPTGTGLGLPICKQIVAAHGGGLGFAKAEPRGTVFVVELPAAGPQMA